MTIQEVTKQSLAFEGVDLVVHANEDGYHQGMRLTAAEPVRKYILTRWDATVRTQREDRNGLVGLPHPFTVPCAKGSYQELYYWDTYFTSVGLLASGRKELALGNLENFIHLVERFGYVPNANRDVLLNRSQPPYLAAMVSLLRTEIRRRRALSGAVQHGFLLKVVPAPQGRDIFKLRGRPEATRGRTMSAADS